MADTAALQIVINAQNNASAQLKEAGASAESAGLSFGKMAGAFVIGNIAAAGITKGVELLHEGIHEAIAENNSMQASWAQIGNTLNNVGSVTGVTHAQVQKLTEQISKTTPVSEGAALAAAGMITPFSQIGKDVFPKVLQASTDLATHLNNGLAPTSEMVAGAAQKMGVAFADPEKSFGRLKKAGVDLTDQQKEAIKTMQDSGNMAGAQKLLFDDLNKVIGGDAVAAGNTFSGKMTEVKNNLVELGARIVDKVQKALVELFDWFEKNKEAIDKVTNVIKSVLKVALDILVATFKTLIDIIKESIQWYEKHKRLANDIAAVLLAVAAAVVIMVTAFKTFEIVKDIIAGVKAAWLAFQLLMEINPIVLILTAIIAVGLLLLTHWKEVKKIAEEVWHKVSEFFENLWKDIKQKFDEGIKYVKDVWGKIVDFFTGIWDGIKDVFHKVVGFIKGIFKDEWEGVKFIWNGVTGFFDELWKDVKKGLRVVKDIFTTPFKDAFNGIAWLWNNTVGKLHFKLPSWVPGLGGKGFDMPNLPMLATGVTNFQGGLAIVGERGPELAYLPKGTNVIPNNRLGQNLSPTINQTNNIYNQMDLTMATRELAWRLSNA